MNELTVNEWSIFEKFVGELRSNLEQNREKLAEYLARMSRNQIKKAKLSLKWLMGADSVERLVLAGRGEISFEQVSLPIPARLWRTLSGSAKKDLKADSEVELLTHNGVVIKTLSKLNPLQASQVIDPKTGILPAEKQRRQGMSGRKRPSNDFEEFDNLERMDSSTVLVVGKPLGHKIRVPIRTLRAILK